ncbi:unnamed protein product [Rotaria magnacalcarata]|uniref:Uncharacterized protein n=1 Tax=Rotaria magnacalcarata TaxID=392030 RepID=A0A820GD87_9BILA|nr:unnamed protein product [Rotaria magnacalcarata]CAF4276015.1 unnamed protein product [Rotaria magnacalcarata]
MYSVWSETLFVTIFSAQHRVILLNGVQQSTYRENESQTTIIEELKDDLDDKVKGHYFSIELPEPGVTELSCFTKNFLHRWYQFDPKALFHLYVVGKNTLELPTTFPNLRIHELQSSLIATTPLKWWLNAHVQWKYKTAMETIAAFDRLNLSYNPSDHPISMFKHLKLVYSIVLLWNYGGTYISTDIALIRAVTDIRSTESAMFVQRSQKRIGLDFISISTSHDSLIHEILIKLSNAYRNDQIMTLDAELIIFETVKSMSVRNSSIELLPESTLYDFDKEAMLSDWHTANGSSEQWALWHSEKYRLGIHFPIFRVPTDTPVPVKRSLIDRLTTLPSSLASSKQLSCFHASTERVHMGQLVYKYNHAGRNNGDYVQAWASIQYYPCVDRFFDRDNLYNLPELRSMPFAQSTFRSKSSTLVSIIMNAWWGQFTETLKSGKYWPPPDHFRPVYISMHIEPLIAGIMLLKRKTYDTYGPVGARDANTLKLLTQKNISSWFSGCLTTTLKFHPLIKSAYNSTKHVLVVDVQRDLLDILVPPDILRENIVWSTAIHNATFANQIGQQLEEFTHTGHRLHELLNSKLVLTGRIHVLLPCLALKIPVMFIFPFEAYIESIRASKSISFVE